jgi:SAM-dependent methyltransferase
LDKDNSNELIRQKVKNKFINEVKRGSVLDFGGGTGLDLGWLTQNNYTVLFCEPSVQMREQAINYNNTILHSNNVLFLSDEKTDFTKWQNENPFSCQVDAALLNFGVINNIKNINHLFKNLSLVIKPGGHFIAIFLKRSLKKMVRWHPKNAVVSAILGIPFTMYVWHNGHKQTVFVHTIKELKKASSPYFNYCGAEFLGGFGFTLIHLVRK